MFHLEITEEERFELTHILENYLSNLLMEIDHTDSRDFKKMLQDRHQTVTEVLEKLRQGAAAS